MCGKRVQAAIKQSLACDVRLLDGAGAKVPMGVLSPYS